MSNTFSAKIVAITKPLIDGAESITDLISYCARVSNPNNQMNFETSKKLLDYLLSHKHFSPLEMANAVVEVNCPRDIARQILRHRSFSFQEFSQRYADVSLLEKSFCIRDLRMQDAKNRQNSIQTEDDRLKEWWKNSQESVLEVALKVYQEALHRGVAKEVARVVLPEGLTMSKLYVNGTIRSWVHYLEVRTEEGVTQEEHVTVAKLIAEIINGIFNKENHDNP